MSRTGLAIVLMGRAVQVFGQVIILWLIARSQGPVGVGGYTLGLALTSPLLLFTHFRIREYLSSHATTAQAWGKYARLQVLWGTAATLGLAAFGAAVYEAEFAVLIAALGATKVVENVVTSANGVSARHGCLVQVALSSIGRSVSNVTFVAVGLVFFQLWVGLALTAVAWLLQYAVFERPRLVAQLRVDRAIAKSGVKSSLALLALGGTALLTSLSPTITRVTLEAYEGAAALGVFAVVAYYVRAGSVFFQSIGQTSSPAIARMRTEGDSRALAKYALTLAAGACAAGVAGLVVLILIGDYLIGFAFGVEMAPGRGLLAGVGLAGVFVFGNTVMAIVAVAVVSGRSFLTYNAISALATLVSALVLIPCYSTIGASLSWAIGSGVQLVLVLLHVWRWSVRAAAYQ